MSQYDLVKAIRDLSSVVVEMIGNHSAAYGQATDWRRDYAEAVRIMEEANKALYGERPVEPQRED